MNSKKNNADWLLMLSCVCLAIGLISIPISEELRKKEYKNIVVKNDKDRMLIRDINNDKQDRILTFRYTSHNEKYLYAGDTIIIWELPDAYNRNRIFNEPNIKYNHDSIYARQQRERFDSIKQLMMKQK